MSYYYLAQVYMLHILSDSPLVQHLPTSQAAELIPYTYLWPGIGLKTATYCATDECSTDWAIPILLIRITRLTCWLYFKAQAASLLWAFLHVPSPSPSPSNWHCMNGWGPYRYWTQSLCKMVCFHWHNVNLMETVMEMETDMETEMKTVCVNSPWEQISYVSVVLFCLEQKLLVWLI